MDYLFETVEDWEKVLGYKVSEAAKIGFSAARLLNPNLNQPKEKDVDFYTEKNWRERYGEY